MLDINDTIRLRSRLVTRTAVGSAGRARVIRLWVGVWDTRCGQAGATPYDAEHGRPAAPAAGTMVRTEVELGLA